MLKILFSLNHSFKFFKWKTYFSLNKEPFIRNKLFLKKYLFISVLGFTYLSTFQEKAICLSENTKNEMLFKISFDDFISMKDKMEILEKQLQQIKECEEIVFVFGLRKSGKTKVITSLTKEDYNVEYSELNLFESFHDKKKRNYIEIPIEITNNNEYAELLEHFFMAKLLKKSSKSMIIFVLKEKYLNNSKLQENLKEALKKMQILLINVDEIVTAERKFIFVVNESGSNSKSEENIQKLLKIINDDGNLTRKRFLNEKKIMEKIQNSKFISLSQLEQSRWSKLISGRINKEAILNDFSVKLMKELEFAKRFDNKLVVESENAVKLKEIRNITENYLKIEIKNIQLKMIDYILSLDDEKIQKLYPDIKSYEFNNQDPSKKIQINSKYLIAILSISANIIYDKFFTEKSVSESIVEAVVNISKDKNKMIKNEDQNQKSFFEIFKKTFLNEREKIKKYLEFLKDNNLYGNLEDIEKLDDLFHYAFDVFYNLEVFINKSIVPLGFKSSELFYLLNHEIFVKMEEEIKRRGLEGDKSKTFFRRTLMKIKYEVFNLINRIDFSN